MGQMCAPRCAGATQERAAMPRTSRWGGGGRGGIPGVQSTRRGGITHPPTTPPLRTPLPKSSAKAAHPFAPFPASSARFAATGRRKARRGEERKEGRS